MPLTIADSIKDRLLADTRPQLEQKLRDIGVETEVEIVAQELFDDMWPAIMKELVAQAEASMNSGVSLGYICAHRLRR